ncbi:hypothetical protein CKA32_005844 [Geitlerinema sp. FC II]|nr:hypothetical protein CKA32_005844 [Geitlerinema sp. FC II]
MAFSPSDTQTWRFVEGDRTATLGMGCRIGLWEIYTQDRTRSG